MFVVRLSIVLLAILIPTLAISEPLGTFRWQMQPYCNVVTVTVTESGGVYRLEGTDGQCGAGGSASAIGTAFLNPDASIGLGLTIVSSPGAAPVHVEATIDPSNLNGTWRDSAGSTGSLVFTNGHRNRREPATNHRHHRRKRRQPRRGSAARGRQLFAGSGHAGRAAGRLRVVRADWHGHDHERIGRAGHRRRGHLRGRHHRVENDRDGRH